MKSLLKFTALCGLTVLLWTCNEDEFLTTPPQGSLNSESLAAEAGINAALISAYSRVDGWANDWGGSAWGTAGSNWLFGSVTTDDAHKGSEPADGATMQQIESYQWRPSLPEFEAKFKVVYDGIRRANETLRLINGNTDLADDTRQRLTGEARFLRGHYSMDAWKIWKNVPYFLEDETEFRKPNDQDIFPLIVADLEFAAANLPAVQDDIGRATSGAANAMLGRLHMLNRDMGAAKTALDKVTGYSLLGCFRDMFRLGEDNENGSEMIFSIQASVNDGTGGSDNGNFADRLNMPHAGSPFGCCGFHQPTQNLVNAYRTTDDGLPALDNSSDSNPTATDNVDPRLDFTVGRDNVPFYGFGNHEPSWIRDRAWSSEYSPKKFAYEPGQESTVGWVGTQLTPINVPIIRYADVLLMLAEIDVANGNLEDARDKVNQIRNRAASCAQGADSAPVAIDDASTAHANYVVGPYTDAWTDATAAREAVRLERRLELALEGHRFFDLRRYGDDYAISTIRDYLAVEAERREFLQAAEPFNADKLIFPIPTAAIQQSQLEGNPTLRQNPGY